ncbi:TIGR03560 family F420-dependent LLM class oxidoreductase [Epidermidibacterium keratini]|uniref:TIGR03560 family F420-dependent LLM class oxidoreductase n=1 Tax=Epidermidibacterium keratini TaxID=1891644 RepID=A0A7L4YP80_9ACTN|nr:LLM class F420-dependent oxidoreductase [Epidermidibacterium keratini]QHC01085.1 TIGR03560 family F420-dependent LLM class oxidoreductase [Epidermidibacterium keratini]
MDLRIFIEPQQGASYDDQLAVARATEELGFDAFFRSDHYLVMGDGDGLPGPTDAMVTLAGLARDTTSVRLGTLVSSSTFRYPGVLAISAAQIDQMSGGRLELGLGTGWYEAEHQAYGIPFPALGERFERLDEQLQILTGLWGTPVGDTFDFSGDYYTITDSPALPKPAQPGGVPIIIGGGGTKRTPRLAARYAAEFNRVFAPLGEIEQQFERVRQACERIERDPATMVLSCGFVACVGRDDAEVSRRAAAIGREVSELKENGLAGTVGEVAEKLERIAQTGATRVYFQVLDLHDLDHLALIAEYLHN